MTVDAVVLGAVVVDPLVLVLLVVLFCVVVCDCWLLSSCCVYKAASAVFFKVSLGVREAMEGSFRSGGLFGRQADSSSASNRSRAGTMEHTSMTPKKQSVIKSSGFINLS